MDQTESAFSIGEVIDALGVTLPTVDETPAAPPAEQETDPAAPTDTTEDQDQSDQLDQSDSTDPSEETDETEDDAEEPDPDAEPTDDEEEAEPAAVRKLTKRVDKLTARAKSAEEQAASLQAELAAARDALTKAQPIVLRDSSDPLADVYDHAALEHRIAAANAVLDNVPDLIAKADMEGEVEVPSGDGSVRKFTKAELQDRLSRARQILRSEPARRNYLAQREVYIREARQVYPELFQDESPARKMMLDTLNAYPGIAKLPNLELIIGDAIRGQSMRFQQQEAMQKKAAKPKAPAAKPAVAPKVVSPSAAPKTKTKADPLDLLKKSGNRDAAESFVASLFN